MGSLKQTALYFSGYSYQSPKAKLEDHKEAPVSAENTAAPTKSTGTIYSSTCTVSIFDVLRVYTCGCIFAVADPTPNILWSVRQVCY